MQENLKMQNEVAKAWVLKAGKKLFISLFTDQTLNIDYLQKPLDPKETDERIMKLRVRCKGLLEALTESLS